MSGQWVEKVLKMMGRACSMVSVFMSVLWREEEGERGEHWHERSLYRRGKERMVAMFGV